MPQPDFSPAAERNKQPILNTLRQVLPAKGAALEIASGTGQHVAWFAAGLPQWTWQPTDAGPDGFVSISAWVAEQHLTNVRPPLVLDVMRSPWLQGTEQFDAVFCANMIHISPWATTAALMRGSALCLAPGGMLVTYGPYLEDEVPTSPGNQSFDQSLRAQNPDWGIRRREDVAREAAKAGLKLQTRYALPANNLLLVWSKA
ncbi:MAG TPA: DUF938 domain-containing protein [Polaromonas sp.]|uniref:DUF938 domain-containing protein n=1 Tax=Polaromonas sp. TaxID=1869339 RepID=UPI002D47BEFB|nr:DUF938 domain-containing protein [Polaromonas sp.]HYW56543.1 DUF938 domain-containing protein [Polaromonas sp.]